MSVDAPNSKDVCHIAVLPLKILNPFDMHAAGLAVTVNQEKRWWTSLSSDSLKPLHTKERAECLQLPFNVVYFYTYLLDTKPVLGAHTAQDF